MYNINEISAKILEKYNESDKETIFKVFGQADRLYPIHDIETFIILNDRISNNLFTEIHNYITYNLKDDDDLLKLTKEMIVNEEWMELLCGCIFNIFQEEHFKEVKIRFCNSVN